MPIEANGWTLNEAMGELPAPSSGAISDELDAALRAGLEERDGCLVLVAASTPSTPRQIGDQTGYEALVNHLHVDTDDRPALPIAIQVAQRVRAMVESRAEFQPVRVIVAAENAASATVRFHRVRDGEQWLADDIDGYNEPVAFCDISVA